MNKYILINDEGDVWCEEQGFGYWGKEKFALSKRDWERRIKKVNLVYGLYLRYSMRKSGIDAIIKKEEENEKWKG